MVERACIILAAGKGSRLGLKDRPKVMAGLYEKPFLHYTVETVLKTNPDIFIVVTGYKGEVIKRYFGKDLRYQDQVVLDGNVGALREGLKGVDKPTKNILVLQGDDSAFYMPDTLQRLELQHERSEADITMLFTDDYEPKAFNSQYVPGDDMRITKMLNRVNSTDGYYFIGTFCVKKEILTNIISRNRPENTPDIILTALNEGKRVYGITAPSGEWRGINTPQELEKANIMMSDRNSLK